MAYNNGKLIRYTGSAWSPSNTEDFFFKVYFNTAVAPTYQDVNVDFLSGDYKGVLLNDSDELTTDTKFLMSVMVDDTVSISWSDPDSPGYDLKDRLPVFFDNLLSRTQTTAISGYTGNYRVSYVDFWIYTTTEINRSLGFTNSLTDIENYAYALFQRGLNSSLLSSVPLITNGLNEQSIVDAFFAVDDTAGNAERVSFLVSYLVEINCLRLEEIFDYWTSLGATIQSGWGTGKNVNDDEAELISTIQDYTDVSEYVVSRWAKSFTPLALVIADGDNSSSDSVALTIQSANAAWNDQGAPIFTFGLGKSQSENYLRSMASETTGKHFYIAESADWDDAETALLHGGDYSIFNAYCNKSYEFNEFTWISEINAVYTPTSEDINGRSCSVEVRWSVDRINFSSWFTVESGVSFILKKLILNLEYRIVMKDGYTGSAVTRPILSSLSHTIVTPSVQYLFTPPQTINGMIFETLLSAAAFLPDTATATWGISRGNSTDFADYAPVHIARKGALPNRQSGVLFTEEVVYTKLPTQTDASALVYFVYTDTTFSKVKTWSETDVITVYQQINLGLEIIVPSTNYNKDGDLGTITFQQSQAGTTIRVTVRTPSTLYVSKGEKATTYDYRTYYLTNGRWSRDNSVIVLVNNKIIRGGYWANPEEGTITFDKEREPTDIVSVYIEFSDIYRVGVEVKNYDPSVDGLGNPIPMEIKNFALFYSVLENVKLQAEVQNTLAPYITDQKILPRQLDSSGNIINPTIYERLTLDYKFNSPDSASESGSTIKWWRYRSGQSLVGQTTQSYLGDTYILLSDYNNRITEKKSDVGTGVTFGSGDKIFIEIIPSDGYSTGVTVKTPIVILDSDKPPYILTLKKPENINTSSPAITAPSDAYTWSVSADSTASYFEAGTYFVGYSFINSNGETTLSKLKSIVLTAYQSIKISSITLESNASGVNYYCSVAPSSYLTLSGTLSFSSSSASVTGTSTKFLTELKVGDSVYSSVNVFLGKILSITNNTSLTLTANAIATYSGSSKLIPVFLAQTNTGGVDTIISEMKETVFVSSPNLIKNATTGLSSAPITDELTAVYTFRNPDNADNVPDETIVEWYLKDNPATVIFTGKTIAANSTTKGQVYIFKATPYNGVRYGTPVWSSSVLMT